MKRKLVLLAGIAIMAAAAMPSLAGYRPNDPGLARTGNWSITTTVGYGAIVNVRANWGSAMCVECHTVNPSTHIFNGGARGIDNAVNYVGNTSSMGSHFVMNILGAQTTALFNITNSKGGFSGEGGFVNTGDAAGKYEKTSAWNGNGGLSKYNTGAALSNNTTGVAGDMICESCHNIIRNNYGQNPALLLGNYKESGESNICEECHAGADQLANNFHTRGNLPAFAGLTYRKRHHVLTGDAIVASFYNGTNTMSNTWAPNISDKVAAGWCGSPYSTQASSLIIGCAVQFRNQCNVAGQGTYAYNAIPAAADIPPQAAATTIECAMCHRPHNAKTGAGAFILRTGNGGDFVGQVGASLAVVNTPGYGIRRQSDVGDYVGNRIYGESAPLCKGCHQGY